MKQWKDLLTNFDLEAIVRMVIVRKNFGDPSRLSRLRPFQARLEISEVNLLEIMFCEKNTLSCCSTDGSHLCA